MNVKGMERLVRCRHGWEDNIEMDSKDVGYGCSHLAYDGVK
jgi:hypothetical protein